MSTADFFSTNSVICIDKKSYVEKQLTEMVFFVVKCIFLYNFVGFRPFVLDHRKSCLEQP